MIKLIDTEIDSEELIAKIKSGISYCEKKIELLKPHVQRNIEGGMSEYLINLSNDEFESYERQIDLFNRMLHMLLSMNNENG